MSMSRKDYEAIAEAMLESKPVRATSKDAEYFAAMDTWRFMLMNLCVAFQNNPRFDRSKFVDACGFNEAKGW